MEDKLRHARHDLRGKINALKLCVSAMEVVNTRAEKLDFLAMIDQSADATVVAMEGFDAVTGQGQPPADR